MAKTHKAKGKDGTLCGRGEQRARSWDKVDCMTCQKLNPEILPDETQEENGEAGTDSSEEE